MFISDFAIKKPLITVVAMVTLGVFGLFALFKLKTDEFPDVAPPVVTIGIPYPGASPEGVEKEILDPIEEQISSITGVKHVNGSAYDGFGIHHGGVRVREGSRGGDAGSSRRDLGEARRPADGDEGADHQEVQRHRSADRVAGAVVDDAEPAELTRLADPAITRELRSISGVAEVEVSGKVERELTVQLEPRRCRRPV